MIDKLYYLNRDGATPQVIPANDDLKLKVYDTFNDIDTTQLSDGEIVSTKEDAGHGNIYDWVAQQIQSIEGTISDGDATTLQAAKDYTDTKVGSIVLPTWKTSTRLKYGIASRSMDSAFPDATINFQTQYEMPLFGRTLVIGQGQASINQTSTPNYLVYINILCSGAFLMVAGSGLSDTKNASSAMVRNNFHYNTSNYNASSSAARTFYFQALAII